MTSKIMASWRMCIDYLLLNKATRKQHFPLPFMDQMLERLASQAFYCYLDGYSGYNQILFKLGNQEKKHFTCLFGLCNAPATFQRCMNAILFDMVEKCIEVFMDDFFLFRNSFTPCLNNFKKVLERCIEKNLVLNWKK